MRLKNEVNGIKIIKSATQSTQHSGTLHGWIAIYLLHLFVFVCFFFSAEGRIAFQSLKPQPGGTTLHLFVGVKASPGACSRGKLSTAASQIMSF